MEIDYVFHVGQWMQLLAKQKATLHAASQRKGERPKDRKSRGQLVREFMLRSAGTSMMLRKKDLCVIHQSWVAASYPPSVAPLRMLKKLYEYIKDLRLEIHYRGFYSLLRVATPPVTMTAVMTVMEDEENDGVVFQLYQQEDDDLRPGEEAVRIQRVCIVKEPYFKVMNDGGYGMRVDHLSDVVWLSSDDERIPRGWRAPRSEFEKTTEALKEEGNLALKAGKLNIAVER